jgi:hypothetical protein
MPSTASCCPSPLVLLNTPKTKRASPGRPVAGRLFLYPAETLPWMYMLHVVDPRPCVNIRLAGSRSTRGYVHPVSV